MHALEQFIQDEDGAVAIEYTLIFAIISMGMMFWLYSLGENLDIMFRNTATLVHEATH